MMFYVIDAQAAPQLVVLVSDDIERVDTVAQTYANQVGHTIVIAEGPAPAQGQFSPIVPTLFVEQPLLPPVTGSLPQLPLVQ